MGVECAKPGILTTSDTDHHLPWTFEGWTRPHLDCISGTTTIYTQNLYRHTHSSCATMHIEKIKFSSAQGYLLLYWQLCPW